MLHPTSLPAGRLGGDAYEFVDWLAAAGQSWWQVLPLGPPDDVGSPYASSSAFAAWRGFLAEPDAPVSDLELGAFRREISQGIFALLPVNCTRRCCRRRALVLVPSLEL